MTDWTVTGPTGTSVAIVSGTFVQNGVTFESQSGARWLDLTGLNSNSTQGVSQTVATTAGNQYQLSFDVGNTTGGSIFGTTSTVNVLINGTKAYADVNSNVSATSLSWEQFNNSCIASNSSTTLALINGDGASDNGNGVDNIVLTDLGPAPVPPPADAWLLLTGVGGLLFLVRRGAGHPAPL